VLLSFIRFADGAFEGDPSSHRTRLTYGTPRDISSRAFERFLNSQLP